MRYFAIFDEKAQLFGQLFPAPTHGAAERSLRESMTNPESPHGRYPEDFSLYHVLDFDEHEGKIIESFEPPRLVVRASALITPSSEG